MQIHNNYSAQNVSKTFHCSYSIPLTEADAVYQSLSGLQAKFKVRRMRMQITQFQDCVIYMGFLEKLCNGNFTAKLSSEKLSCRWYAINRGKGGGEAKAPLAPPVLPPLGCFTHKTSVHAKREKTKDNSREVFKHQVIFRWIYIISALGNWVVIRSRKL